MSFKNFRTLDLAVNFYKECEAIKCKPHVRDQLSRSSLSVVNNLAEGGAKSSIKDRARYYEIALASFRESQAMLRVLDQKEMLLRSDYLGASLYKLHNNTLFPQNPGHQNQKTPNTFQMTEDRTQKNPRNISKKNPQTIKTGDTQLL